MIFQRYRGRLHLLAYRKCLFLKSKFCEIPSYYEPSTLMIETLSKSVPGNPHEIFCDDYCSRTYYRVAGVEVGAILNERYQCIDVAHSRCSQKVRVRVGLLQTAQFRLYIISYFHGSMSTTELIVDNISLQSE